jgi:DNA-binding transcriptional ArsR family regulator
LLDRLTYLSDILYIVAVPAYAAPDVFNAVASPIRRSLLALLRAGETPATELAEKFELTQPAISQQLKVLRQAGLVGERRVGRQRLYHLNPGPLREVAEWVKEYESFWNERLDRLGSYIERAEARQGAPAPSMRKSSTRRRKGTR